MPTLIIPAAIRRLMNAPSPMLKVEAQTIGEVLAALTTQYPELRETFFDADGHRRRVVRVFIGEDDIETLEGPDTPVAEADEIVLLPPIAGG